MQNKINIIYKNIDELIPYINNPRRNEGAIDAVASSIKNFGFKQPIVIDDKNEIIAGHTRLLASKKLGLEEVPVIIADDLNEGQIKAYRLADNKVGELAEWDYEALEIELDEREITKIVERIAGKPVKTNINIAKQDIHLADNQKDKMRCGDNGIFKGVPISKEERELSEIARNIYDKYPHDGKYIIDNEHLVICQSNVETEKLKSEYKGATINPLGNWTGGFNVDAGATNRKLGSDMGRAVTGGGLHGKDLSKADVSVNIYAHIKAQEIQKEINLSCAIGDEEIDNKPYEQIVDTARRYIDKLGGFEKLAEWGLI